MDKLMTTIRQLQKISTYGAYHAEFMSSINKIVKQTLVYEEFVEQHQSEFNEFLLKKKRLMFIMSNNTTLKNLLGKKASCDDVYKVLDYKTFDEYLYFFRQFHPYDLRNFNEKQFADVHRLYDEFEKVVKFYD